MRRTLLAFAALCMASAALAQDAVPPSSPSNLRVLGPGGSAGFSDMVRRNSITWRFSGEHEVGQFI
ncbi:MAG: hypothetical protein JXA90_06355, partial [Planctomycetes bacterium]|nr:hypothetical protein [Planctomycetota bacterium]